MCWQCGAKPESWLNMFDSFSALGWWVGPGTGDGVFEFLLEGTRYYTNPEIEIVEWMKDALPGEVDQNGVPWYVEGAFVPAPGATFRIAF